MEPQDFLEGLSQHKNVKSSWGPEESLDTSHCRVWFKKLQVLGYSFKLNWTYTEKIRSTLKVQNSIWKREMKKAWPCEVPGEAWALSASSCSVMYCALFSWISVIISLECFSTRAAVAALSCSSSFLWIDSVFFSRLMVRFFLASSFSLLCLMVKTLTSSLVLRLPSSRSNLAVSFSSSTSHSSWRPWLTWQNTQETHSWQQIHRLFRQHSGQAGYWNFATCYEAPPHLRVQPSSLQYCHGAGISN